MAGAGKSKTARRNGTELYMGGGIVKGKVNGPSLDGKERVWYHTITKILPKEKSSGKGHFFTEERRKMRDEE